VKQVLEEEKKVEPMEIQPEEEYSSLADKPETPMQVMKVEEDSVLSQH
jgi:hypothetical protein